MFSKLSASGYLNNSVFYNKEFEDILSKIIVCYKLMLADNVDLTNDENAIRDFFLIKYLKNNDIRKEIGLINYLFDREVPEDTSIGRTDIKIQTLNTFVDTAAYYTIECKRLDAINLAGTTGLNAKYIENGICRFTSKTYSTYYKTNGMMGFVTQSIDIHQNVVFINQLLKNSFSQANTNRELMQRNIVHDFDYAYSSTHDTVDGEILIYHLMFDFTGNIK
ncbi:MAG TPA: hypothetical protein VGN20_04685 [Mucilaginibacter sp.]|jgi:hypothetical protein